MAEEKQQKQEKPKKGKDRGPRGRGRRQQDAAQEEFQQRLVDLARVTRVMAGGKRMNFRACVVIGDLKGRVGYGLAKGADVTIAINKAVSQAKKNVIHVPIVEDTIPHQSFVKFKAAKILMKPAVQGTGVKAGGAVRTVMELAGVKNISAKILGSNNKVNIVKATVHGLSKLRPSKFGQVQKKGKKQAK